MSDEKLDATVTAHHLNDELETFLINLSRGSGVRGLSGIPRDKNRILRPLLSFTKKEIYDYASVNSVQYREDSSNAKGHYLRNRFRNNAIPELEAAATDFLHGFSQSLSHLKEADDYIRHQINAALSEVTIRSTSDEMVFDRSRFLALHPFLFKAILLKYGFRGDEFDKISRAENGKMFRSRSHEFSIFRYEIIIRLKAK